MVASRQLRAAAHAGLHNSSLHHMQSEQRRWQQQQTSKQQGTTLWASTVWIQSFSSRGVSRHGHPPGLHGITSTSISRAAACPCTPGLLEVLFSNNKRVTCEISAQPCSSFWPGHGMCVAGASLTLPSLTSWTPQGTGSATASSAQLRMRSAWAVHHRA